MGKREEMGRNPTKPLHLKGGEHPSMLSPAGNHPPPQLQLSLSTLGNRQQVIFLV